MEFQSIQSLVTLMSKYETLDNAQRELLLKKLQAEDPDLHKLFLEILQKQHIASRYIDDLLQDLSSNISERLPDLESGKNVGSYQVGEEIGRGGIAVVYQATVQMVPTGSRWQLK